MIFFIASEHFCWFCHRLLLLIMGRQQQQQQILMKFLRWLASYHQLWLDPIVFNIMIEPSCLHSCIIDPSINMAKRKNQWRRVDSFARFELSAVGRRFRNDVVLFNSCSDIPLKKSIAEDKLTFFKAGPLRHTRENLWNINPLTSFKI